MLDTHTQHTSLMFNEYLFHLCDCTYLNVMCVCSIAWWSNPKRFLSILFVSGSDFCLFGCESFSQNVKFFLLKNFMFSHFATPFCEWFQVTRFFRYFNFLKISSREFQGSLASASRLSPNLRNSALCICTFRK